jgi:hypothetical protein
MNQKLITTPLLCLSLIGNSFTVDAADSTPEKETAGQLTEMRALRKEAAQKQRRVLYNDDGNHELPYKTPEELISLRVKQIANTQVDAIFYCTGGSGLFWGHNPKVGELLGQFVTEESGVSVKDMRDGLVALKKLGTDPLATVVDYVHKNNMEVIWSYRMNNSEEADVVVSWGLSQRKRTHPSYLMGTAADWDEHRPGDPKVWWALEDFAQPEVRDYIVKIFEDICQRYDIDGIELDFIRAPLFFRSNMEGLPATPAEVAMMTDMVRKIRAMTERVALERGRPILVVIRAPLSVASCLAIGLDIPAYLKEGLMDILIAGQDYVQMGVASELKDMVDLGHKYDVPVYALIAPPKPYAVYNDSRAWRGAVMNRWYWGADGIYTFNLFPNSPNEKFSEFGSPDTLKGLDKIYGIDNPGEESILGTFKMSTVAPNRLPVTLSSVGYVTTKLPVGEDIVANTPIGKGVSALLRFKIAGLETNQQVLVKVNGQVLGTPTVQGIGLEMKVDPKLIVPGYNQVELKLESPQKGDATVTLEDLVVTYK